MKPIWLTHVQTVVFSMLALSIPVSAIAQYVWLDEKGSKHYSDTPPPPAIPMNKILKAPGSSKAMPLKNTEPLPITKAEEEHTAKSAATAPKTMAEKNADFIKRKTEQAAKEKKSADEAKRLADNAKNCERTREYQKALDSGQRIAQTDKNGERALMSDDQRAQEMRDTKQILAECK